MERRIKKFLKERETKGLLRRLTTISPLGGGKILLSGRECINFSSNDYLGLSSHPELIKAAQEALSPSFGSSASRLMAGSTYLHHLLEERTASFKDKPAVLVFNSGYQANIGIISALYGKGDCIFSDKLNHASIIDGISLSGAKLFRFRHNDVGHLQELLRRNRKNYRQALIVTETVFSMDGDFAPIEEMIHLKKEHDCMFMVDEAHATGIFGERGSGLTEAKEKTGEVDIIMGTFSKALGAFGAYVATSRIIRDFLINASRSFIYSTALPGSVIAANLASLKLIKTEPHRRKTLLARSQYFRNKLRENGFDVRGQSQIVPIMVGDIEKTVRMSSFLKRGGWWVTPVRPPTVPDGKARLRISLTFDHTREMLDRFLEDIRKCHPPI